MTTTNTKKNNKSASTKSASTKNATTKSTSAKDKNNHPVTKNRQNIDKKSTKQKPNRKPKAPEQPYKVIPLGGLKEIGKNCTLIESGNDILVIDCGFAFPEYEMFGVDIVIPDFTYLKENKDRIRGVIITHGHEDHIGGIPYFLKEINVPIYAAPLAMGLINHKLEEHRLHAETHVIKPGDTFKVGKFNIEAIQINHSIIDSLAFSIKFPGGHIVHTGDFKVDYSPLDGKVIDLNRFSRLGDEGVDLLLCDSTNATRAGYTPSEAVVRKSIDDIFSNTDKRIIIATFSSNVHRIKYFIESSMKHKRRIAVSGRSMENVLALAKGLGYLDNIPESIFVNVANIKEIQDKNLTIITTGSQGEPMSALTRMANDNHRSVKLKKNDMVVFSSSPIPGNEKVISHVINKLYEKKVEVVLASMTDVHVSGHASSEELKLIHTLVRPRFFMPAHGEYRHLIEHSKIAQALGQSPENIFILSNGDALNVTGKTASITTGFTSGEGVMVDGYGIGDVGNVVLKDRKSLSQSGLVTIAVAIDSATGSLMSKPELRTRGFVYVQEHQDLLDDAMAVVYNTLGHCSEKKIKDEASLSKAIRDDVKSFIYKKTKRNPMILPIILYI